MTDVDLEAIVDLDIETDELPVEMTRATTPRKPKRKKTAGSGRKKGTKNKDKAFGERYIADALTTVGCCPLRSLVRVGRKAEKEGQYSSAIKAYSDILGYIQAKPRAPLVAIESKGNLVFKWQDEAETKEENFIIDQTSGDRE